MTLLFLVLAILGWLLAISLLGMLIVVSLAFGVIQSDLKSLQKDVETARNKKASTSVWNINPHKETPFSD